MALKTSLVQTELASPYLVSLAFSRTSSSVSNGSTVSTGPKISIWTHSEPWSTSAMTVGWKKAPPPKPGTDARAPPLTMRAPASRARFTKPSTRSTWPWLMSEPMSVLGSAGSPTRTVST